jgi:hypothetical protein
MYDGVTFSIDEKSGYKEAEVIIKFLKDSNDIKQEAIYTQLRNDPYVSAENETQLNKIIEYNQFVDRYLAENYGIIPPAQYKQLSYTAPGNPSANAVDWQYDHDGFKVGVIHSASGGDLYVHNGGNGGVGYGTDQKYTDPQAVNFITFVAMKRGIPVSVALSTAEKETNNWRHFNSSGSGYSSENNDGTYDWGLMQINTVHEKYFPGGEYAIRFDMDIVNNWQDNVSASMSLLKEAYNLDAVQAEGSIGPHDRAGNIASSAYSVYNGGPGAYDRYRTKNDSRDVGFRDIYKTYASYDNYYIR